ncbi:hypothetical protein [Magnetococcus sp. PR-3]|uniref:hypothetical protein n=1 Tax=Magnetococcus sp. PR-3 TaxID=3120355 RepID=UPI002FCE2F58
MPFVVVHSYRDSLPTSYSLADSEELANEAVERSKSKGNRWAFYAALPDSGVDSWRVDHKNRSLFVDQSVKERMAIDRLKSEALQGLKDSDLSMLRSLEEAFSQMIEQGVIVPHEEAVSKLDMRMKLRSKL